MSPLLARTVRAGYRSGWSGSWGRAANLQIDELDKPAGEWCRHCRPGHGGCTIYDRRPGICSGFTCAWLQGDLPEHWRPEASHMFAHGRDTGEGHVLCIYVDPRFNLSTGNWATWRNYLSSTIPAFCSLPALVNKQPSSNHDR